MILCDVVCGYVVLYSVFNYKTMFDYLFERESYYEENGSAPRSAIVATIHELRGKNIFFLCRLLAIRGRGKRMSLTNVISYSV